MKRISIYLIFIFFARILQSQVVSSNCTADELVLALYRNDADRMAIRHVNEVGSSYKDSVRINEKVSRNFLNALVAVHNATMLPANDTIIRLLNIHTYNPGLNSLVVIADSNLVWMTNLRYNILPTRDNAIDQMISAYSLKKVFYSGLLQPSMVVFRTDENRNLAPLAKKFKTYLGVKASEAEYLYGDGNDITDTIYEKYVELFYSYGWEDCPSGCVKRRYWKFRVFLNCTVEYLGSYGSALEPPIILSVQEGEGIFSNIKLYPSPAKNKLYIEYDPLKNRNLALTLTNKKGEVVYTLKGLKPKQEIDLILLSSGTYQLKLQDGSQKKVYKLNKQ